LGGPGLEFGFQKFEHVDLYTWTDHIKFAVTTPALSAVSHIYARHVVRQRSRGKKLDETDRFSKPPQWVPCAADIIVVEFRTGYWIPEILSRPLFSAQFGASMSTDTYVSNDAVRFGV
jgi:hypothetical protein